MQTHGLYMENPYRKKPHMTLALFQYMKIIEYTILPSLDNIRGSQYQAIYSYYTNITFEVDFEKHKRLNDGSTLYRDRKI